MVPGLPGPFSKLPAMFGQITEFGFFEKIFFFDFGGYLKTFLTPKDLGLGLTNLTFGGVILLKLFDPSHGFGDFEG